MNGFDVITILTLLPLVGGLIIIGFGPHQNRLARGLAMGVAFASLALTLLICTAFDRGSGDLQFEKSVDWIPSLAVKYHVGLDGLGLFSRDPHPFWKKYGKSDEDHRYEYKKS